MRILFIILLSFTIIPVQSQDFALKKNQGGLFSLGGRSTVSFFNDGSWRNVGTGVGGHFRIQLEDRVNTEWFFDYITGGIGNFAHRTDYHIGWSVIYYLTKPAENLSLISPYILAGHCFDYSRIQANSDKNNLGKRWSSAVQVGGGTHFNITQRFDLSFTLQYMIHLGGDVHAHEENGLVEIHKEKGVNLEGHILSTISINYKIADLW